MGDTTGHADGTIPGCYCRDCIHANVLYERTETGDYSAYGLECTLTDCPAYDRLELPDGFGCTFGERREAE